MIIQNFIGIEDFYGFEAFDETTRRFVDYLPEGVRVVQAEVYPRYISILLYHDQLELGIWGRLSPCSNDTEVFPITDLEDIISNWSIDYFPVFKEIDYTDDQRDFLVRGKEHLTRFLKLEQWFSEKELEEEVELISTVFKELSQGDPNTIRYYQSVDFREEFLGNLQPHHSATVLFVQGCLKGADPFLQSMGIDRLVIKWKAPYFFELFATFISDERNFGVNYSHVFKTDNTNFTLIERGVEEGVFYNTVAPSYEINSAINKGLPYNLLPQQAEEVIQVLGQIISFITTLGWEDPIDCDESHYLICDPENPFLL